MIHESSHLAPETHYLTRRESQEQLAAERSTDPAVRRIHAALAESYAEQLKATMPAAG